MRNTDFHPPFFCQLIFLFYSIFTLDMCSWTLCCCWSLVMRCFNVYTTTKIRGFKRRMDRGKLLIWRWILSVYVDCIVSYYNPLRLDFSLWTLNFVSFLFFSSWCCWLHLYICYVYQTSKKFNSWGEDHSDVCLCSFSSPLFSAIFIDKLQQYVRVLTFISLHTSDLRYNI